MKKLIALILMIVLVSSMSACGKSDDKKDEVKQDEVVVNQDVNKEDTTIKEEEEEEKQEETKEESNLKDGMRIEFKEAMDAYEAFYDDYVDFMKKYNENPSDLTLMMELGDMTSKLSDMEDKFAKWEDEDLNDAELKYYIEVQNRVSKKLLDVATN